MDLYIGGEGFYWIGGCVFAGTLNSAFDGVDKINALIVSFEYRLKLVQIQQTTIYNIYIYFYPCIKYFSKWVFTVKQTKWDGIIA